MKEQPTKLNKVDRKDFRGYTFLPGTEGNPFDSILRLFNGINQIPILFFLSGIGVFAYIATLFQFDRWIILISAFVIDFLVISSLPLWKITFGPAQSQVFLLFILRIPFIWLPFPYNLTIQILGNILVLIGFVYEPSKISITKREIQSPHLQSITPVRFVQIGDIHLEKIGIREQKLIKILTELSPDFILFTGDFLNLSNNADPKAISDVINLFNQMNQIGPTFYVTGSPAVDLEQSIQAIRTKTKAKNLNNENTIVVVNKTRINLLGVACTHQPNQDYEFVKRLNSKDGEINILLYHSPDLIYEINEEDNIQLMLSGHTHGGQVRIPFFGALFTGSLYHRKLQTGLYQMGQTLLSISRGIGFEGMGAPRVRILCKPELIQWTINKEEKEF